MFWPACSRTNLKMQDKTVFHQDNAHPALLERDALFDEGA